MKKRERLTPEQLNANYYKMMKGKEMNKSGKILSLMKNLF